MQKKQEKGLVEMKFGLKLFGILLLYFLGINATFAESQNSLSKVITIADIHFDPFAGCESLPKPCPIVNQLRQANYTEWSTIFEKMGETKMAIYDFDTNYPLLKSSLEELEIINKKEKAVFAMILGDFLAHDFYKKYRKYSGDTSKLGYQLFVKKTLQYLTMQFNKIFSNIDVYSVVGNNDSYTGNYNTLPNGQFFKDTAYTWSTLIKNPQNKAIFMREFSFGGYYCVDNPANKNQKIIVLNSVFFAKKSKIKSIHQAALIQLKWLNAQLKQAELYDQHVWVVYHIPVDMIIKVFWHLSYIDQFQNTLQRFSHTITGLFSAHIHYDPVKLITIRALTNLPVNFTPSISPIYGNDPGLKVFSYDIHTFKLKKADNYELPLSDENPKWVLAGSRMASNELNKYKIKA